MHKYTNDLIHETSPYLLQHAHNPVRWKAWNENTLNLALKENKLLLISVGYSACHWCHVMEHESFEDETVAKLMNESFICVKVDREERPDVDQVYMDAVNLLTGRGGWPLNVVALPNGKPFWGGTYFPKDNWIKILAEITRLWQSEPQKLKDYAEQLTKGIRDKDLPVKSDSNKKFKASQLSDILNRWKTRFDDKLGGYNHAPKFPMPNNYQFLLRYAVQSDNRELMNFVKTTLTKMAYGGIYDHIGGGFARYSTDTQWHIPHFEKMLYDNAQLVSLYSEAYLVTEDSLYKEIVYQTLQFVAREMTAPNGLFYSSLDADSKNRDGENEEGAYYVWRKNELKHLLRKDFELFKDYYNINSYGFWEDDKYVLIRNASLEKIAQDHRIKPSELHSKVQKWQTLLLKERVKRSSPGLDDKVLTSWNALMLKGYIDAYRVFYEPEFLSVARKNIHCLLTQMLRKDGGLNHNYKNGTSNINAFLEDYATLIDALITLYEITLEEKYLRQAKQLNDYTLDHFFDKETQFFYFTSDEDPQLVARKMEIIDNVIPASNSIMARNLFKLGHYYNHSYYKKISEQMLRNIFDQINAYPSGYSNWLQQTLDFVGDYYEIVITGPGALKKLKEINQVYIPNKLIAGSMKTSGLPLLQNRFRNKETWLYICVNNACQLPTEKVSDALQQIQTRL